jgi:hypothetical protein
MKTLQKINENTLTKDAINARNYLDATNDVEKLSAYATNWERGHGMRAL